MPQCTVSNQNLTVVTKGTPHVAVATAPDECFVPGKPTAQPFPNFVPSCLLLKGKTDTVFIERFPILTMKGELGPVSFPAHEGTRGGRRSGTYRMEANPTCGSLDVFIEGCAVIRCSDTTTQNHGNTEGRIGFLDMTQGVLDVAGFWGPVGPFADGFNALISALRGNLGEAGFNVLAAVPIAGDAAKAGKMAKKAMSLGDEAAGAARVARNAREVTYAGEQLQKKFKHAGDFGVQGNYNRANGEKFREALDAHTRDPGTRVIPGEYHGNPVTHLYNPKTGNNVVVDPQGGFVSGWKLSPAQTQHVLTTGKLGGGG